MGLHELEDEVMMHCPHCGGPIDYNNEAMDPVPTCTEFFDKALDLLRRVGDVGGGTGIAELRKDVRRFISKVDKHRTKVQEFDDE